MNNNDNWYPQHGPEEGTKLRTRQRPKPATIWAIVATIIAVIFGGVLLMILMANQTTPPTNNPLPEVTLTSTPFSGTTGNAPTATTASTPTPTQTPATAAGSILCNYDASSGFNSWSNTSEWKPINDGTFGSDGTGDGTGSNGYIAWSDCKPSTANYAVEAQIQYVRSTNKRDGFEFGIILHGDGNKAGYEVGAGFSVNCNQQTLKKVIVTLVKDDQISTSDGACGDFTLSPLQGKDYQLDTQLHTYRAEITGNTIRLSLDGHALLETTDNTYTDAGQLGLRDVYGSINVKSYKVTAL